MRTQTEWFSARVMGGSYGGGAEGMLFTLRWRYVVWEILRGGVAGGGVGFRNRPDSFFFCLGTAVGLQFQVGRTPRDELRVMAGVAGGTMSQNTKTIEMDDFTPPYTGKSSIGPILSAEFSWVHHFLQHFALQVGIETFIPTMEGGGWSSCEADCGLPEPPLMVFVGFRI